MKWSSYLLKPDDLVVLRSFIGGQLTPKVVLGPPHTGKNACHSLLWWFGWGWPCRFINLIILSQVGRTFGEGLWGMALEKEVCYWGVLWGLKSPYHHSQLTFYLMLVDQNGSSHLLLQGHACLPTCCHATPHNSWTLTLWNVNPRLNTLFYKLTWLGCFIIAKEVTKTLPHK